MNTSDIEVGDWVQRKNVWARVVWHIQKCVTGVYEPAVNVDNGGNWLLRDITAHRSKNGPFKVGDEVEYTEESAAGGGHRTITKITNRRIYYSYPSAWDYATDSQIVLHRPVEAIEAEKKPDDDMPDETLIALLENRGYQVTKPEPEVTLPKCPECGSSIRAQKTIPAGVWWHVVCGNCGWNSGTFKTEAEAIAAARKAESK